MRLTPPAWLQGEGGGGGGGGKGGGMVLNALTSALSPLHSLERHPISATTGSDLCCLICGCYHHDGPGLAALTSSTY